MTRAQRTCIFILSARHSSGAEGAEERMAGIITTKDVVANVGLIWREFGAACLLRCAVAVFLSVVTGKATTFLAVVMAGR